MRPKHKKAVTRTEEGQGEAFQEQNKAIQGTMRGPVGLGCSEQNGAADGLERLLWGP